MEGTLKDNVWLDNEGSKENNNERLGSLGLSSAFGDIMGGIDRRDAESTPPVPPPHAPNTIVADNRHSIAAPKNDENAQPSSQLQSPTMYQSPKEIVDAAKRGSYSPAAAQALSLVTRARADSRSSKTSAYGTRKEPILEGQPLAEFTGRSRQNSTYSHFSSRNISRAPSIAEIQEENALGRRPLAVRNPSKDEDENGSSELGRKMNNELERPFTTDSADLGGQPLRPFTAESPAEVEMQQAQRLFEDFDGQHIETAPPSPPPPPPPGLDKRQSSATLLSPLTPNFDRPKSYADPLTGQQMVFYPAPVPANLQLPAKLSKRPNANARAQRHTQVLSTAPAPRRPAAEARKSALWLPEVDIADDDKRKTFMDEDFSTPSLVFPKSGPADSVAGKRATQDMTLLPDQLRANEYFEQIGPTRLVEIKEQSAVRTLDNFLDESAFAPVHAFTDHEIVGRLGAGVYAPEKAKPHGGTQMFGSDRENVKPEKRKSSFFGLVGANRSEDGNEGRKSTLNILRSKSPAYKGVETKDKSPDTSDSEEEESDSEQHQHAMPEEDDQRFHGQPTTLLAELQLRKQQAKERTKPSNMPSGYRSTLLEMDAVAQKTHQKRQQKRVTLAWQDKAVVDEERDMEDEDDDMPLGELFPELARKQMRDADRPMGLMEARELEDNEPLSKRRERLLGKQPLRRPELMTRQSMMSLGVMNTKHNSNSTDTITPGASISQTNLARPISGANLSDGKRDSALLPPTRPVSGEFSTEILRSLGATPEPDLDVPEEEETLGQRRRRLLAEKEAREKEVGVLGANRTSTPNPEKGLEAKPQLKQRRSMADVLQAHPAREPIIKVPTTEERLQKLRPSEMKHSRHPSAEFPHLVEFERERERKAQNMAKQEAAVRGQAAAFKSPGLGMNGMPAPLVHRASNLGMANYQAQQGLTTGFPTLISPTGQGASPYGMGAGSYFPPQPSPMMGMGMGMLPQAQSQNDLMNQMQMRVRMQQAQQGAYGAAGAQQQQQAAAEGQWRNQQAQWAHWARMQGLGMGMGGGVMNSSGGVDQVEAWRRGVGGVPGPI